MSSWALSSTFKEAPTVHQCSFGFTCTHGKPPSTKMQLVHGFHNICQGYALHKETLNVKFTIRSITNYNIKHLVWLQYTYCTCTCTHVPMHVYIYACTLKLYCTACDCSIRVIEGGVTGHWIQQLVTFHKQWSSGLLHKLSTSSNPSLWYVKCTPEPYSLLFMSYMILFFLTATCKIKSSWSTNINWLNILYDAKCSGKMANCVQFTNNTFPFNISHPICNQYVYTYTMLSPLALGTHQYLSHYIRKLCNVGTLQN